MLAGFADEITWMNTVPTQDNMVMLEGIGRAYARAGAPGYYAAAIHTSAVSVTAEPHVDLMRGLGASKDFRDDIYMGCAGFLNFSYICAMRPAGAVLFDINPLQTMFWRHVIRGLANSPTFRSFVRYMRDLGPRLEQDVLNGCGPVQLSPQEIKPLPFAPRTGLPKVYGLFRETYLSDSNVTDSCEWWMSDSPEWRWCGKDYIYLHVMAKSNAIGALTLDLHDDAGWAQLGDHLVRQDRRVGVLYESNTRDFFTRGRDWSKNLCDDHTLTKINNNFNRVARGESLFVINDKGCAPLRDALHGMHLA